MENSINILSIFETESIVENLKVFSLENIGSQEWFDQHNLLSKLVAQSVLNATLNEEEFVKEALVSFNKISTLVQDLIVVSVWKENVFPILIEQCVDLTSSLPIYTVLFHEGAVLNLLETVLYHHDALQSIPDELYDLFEYCYEKVVYNLVNSNVSSVDVGSELDAILELKKQYVDLNNTISLKALTTLCYICDQISDLPLTITNQILKIRDVPMVLVQLIHNPPWLVHSSKLSANLCEYNPSKIEGLVWVCLLRLLLDPECQKKYEFNGYKKNRILSVQSYITHELLDNIPSLELLQNYLQHLSVFDPPEPKSDLIVIEMISFKDNLIKMAAGKWECIADSQRDRLTNSSFNFIMEHSKKMSEIYEMKAIETLIPEKPKCSNCFRNAYRKCSQCQCVWYCDRNCQAKDWAKHKITCKPNSSV